MSYNNILVALPPGANVLAPYAASAAMALGARLHAAGLALDPALPGYVTPEIPFAVLDRIEEEARTDARKRLAEFEGQTRAAGSPVHAFLIEGDIDTAFEDLTRIARRHDLTIAEQAGPDRPAHSLMLETLLFGAGRPMLVVPYIQRERFSLRSVLVGWNDSASAARAVAAASPLLERAQSIEIVTVDARDADREGGSELATLLAGRGVETRFKSLTAAGGVADTLLSHAADTGADMIVMGAYGHSRLREFVLGGATRDMLATMTVPVLMSH